MSEDRYRSECMGHDRATQIQSHLADLSTEELQDKLAELILDESEADEDAIALIDAISAELDNRNPCEHIVTAEESLENFHNKYPILFRDAPKEAAPRRSHPIRYGVMVAAITVLVCVFAVQAMGVNVIDVIARWTSETFSLTFPGYEDAAPAMERNEAYAELQSALDAHGITAPLVPRYLPEGYEASEFYASEDGSLFLASYQNGNNDISIRIKEISNGTGYQVEINNDDPNVYSVENVDHHIMKNTDTYSASWQNGGFECEIFNVASEDLLYDIIDSIYTG